MEPRIRYVHSADGTRIAVWTLGEGPPLVATPGTGFASMQIMWELPGLRAMFERLGTRRTILAYDHRGFGLSDHEAADHSLAALCADLAAVVELTGGQPFDLIGRATGGIPAIIHAAESPRVRRLALVYSAASGAEFTLNPRRRALAPLIDVDFALYCQALALVDFGWTDLGRRFADLLQTIRPASFKASWLARRGWDAREHLARVRCPTLVVWYDSAEQFTTLAAARTMAAGIPDARLLVLKGLPVRAEAEGEQMADELLAFLDDAGSAPVRRGPAPAAGTVVVLFADIAGSTALTEHLGDTAFRDRARSLDEALRGAVRAAGGTPIEGRLLGDGVLAVFGSARQALAAAEDCRAAGAAADLPLHLGLHAGDVIAEDGNVYGGTVNIAARVAELAAPGEVLVSDTVRGLARTSAGVDFADRGSRLLKGLAEPLRLWAARPQA